MVYIPFLRQKRKFPSSRAKTNYLIAKARLQARASRQTRANLYSQMARMGSPFIVNQGAATKARIAANRAAAIKRRAASLARAAYSRRAVYRYRWQSPPTVYLKNRVGLSRNIPQRHVIAIPKKPAPVINGMRKLLGRPAIPTIPFVAPAPRRPAAVDPLDFLVDNM